MSTKNTIARTATAIADLEAALEATRQEHAAASSSNIEAKITAFAEVVRNTRRKMDYPAGFDWALHHSFRVIAITETHLKVTATPLRGGDRVTLDIPRADLSLSTWQATSAIRRLSAERLLADLKTTVTSKQEAVATARKEADAAAERLTKSEQTLADAKAAVERRIAKTRKVEAKREAARARKHAAKNKQVTAA